MVATLCGGDLHCPRDSAQHPFRALSNWPAGSPQSEGLIYARNSSLGLICHGIGDALIDMLCIASPTKLHFQSLPNDCPITRAPAAACSVARGWAGLVPIAVALWASRSIAAAAHHRPALAALIALIVTNTDLYPHHGWH